ncbi:uncharacterized protein SCODWIG_03333 [Saccharomycodes ludwigii]|uniref:Transcription activator GCR1-like domain-containing protein n=1 Tax=Saccharomycodes ludwigii TaxID=36035 RepID=A0A376BA85_9ASCO|nr:hypothetical protein SCDLUD_005037 [Saccharomycodes ludwigii]KAH3898713.1 hypothetical protein SCDLUD_005037 [Saccharomycodes ludwigii]SSD61572.1 uncharacterized protein SCODWIG_03333 [Saccharomycodes ludwigii]
MPLSLPPPYLSQQHHSNGSNNYHQEATSSNITGNNTDMALRLAKLENKVTKFETLFQTFSSQLDKYFKKYDTMMDIQQKHLSSLTYIVKNMMKDEARYYEVMNEKYSDIINGVESLKSVTSTDFPLFASSSSNPTHNNTTTNLDNILYPPVIPPSQQSQVMGKDSSSFLHDVGFPFRTNFSEENTRQNNITINNNNNNNNNNNTNHMHNNSNSNATINRTNSNSDAILDSLNSSTYTDSTTIAANTAGAPIDNSDFRSSLLVRSEINANDGAKSSNNYNNDTNDNSNSSGATATTTNTTTTTATTTNNNGTVGTNTIGNTDTTNSTIATITTNSDNNNNNNDNNNNNNRNNNTSATVNINVIDGNTNDNMNKTNKIPRYKPLRNDFLPPINNTNNDINNNDNKHYNNGITTRFPMKISTSTNNFPDLDTTPIKRSFQLLNEPINGLAPSATNQRNPMHFIRSKSNSNANNDGSILGKISEDGHKDSNKALNKGQSNDDQKHNKDIYKTNPKRNGNLVRISNLPIEPIQGIANKNNITGNISSNITGTTTDAKPNNYINSNINSSSTSNSTSSSSPVTLNFEDPNLQEELYVTKKGMHKKRKLYIGTFKFLSSPSSVLEIWQEYMNGCYGQPSIKDMELTYHTSWRRSAAVAKRFSRRNVLYKAIKKGLQKGLSLNDCILILENARIIHDNKNNKKNAGSSDSKNNNGNHRNDDKYPHNILDSKDDSDGRGKVRGNNGSNDDDGEYPKNKDRVVKQPIGWLCNAQNIPDILK